MYGLLSIHIIINVAFLQCADVYRVAESVTVLFLVRKGLMIVDPLL